VRRPAHQHRFEHGKTERGHVLLRDIREALCALARRERIDPIAVDEHAARLCRQQAEQRPKERRLARAVAAEHSERLAGFERERHLAADAARAEPEREVVDL
jgi:hypothetical protein